MYTVQYYIFFDNTVYWSPFYLIFDLNAIIVFLYILWF